MTVGKLLIWNFRDKSSVFHDIDLTESALRFVHGLGRLRNESQSSNADRVKGF
jgi:hypothetical protein